MYVYIYTYTVYSTHICMYVCTYILDFVHEKKIIAANPKFKLGNKKNITASYLEYLVKIKRRLIQNQAKILLMIRY